MRNNSTNISFWKNIKQGIFTILKVIQKNLTSFTTKYPRLSEVIQLTFIYYFAVVDLLYGILSNVFALGYFPEILRNLYPTIKSILTNPLFQMWNSPEKIFFLSYSFISLRLLNSNPGRSGGFQSLSAVKKIGLLFENASKFAEIFA